MKCGAARKHLYLVHDSENESTEYPIEAEVLQAKSHVSHCSACREFFAAEEQLKDFLKRRAPREKAPAVLREELLFGVARERGRSRSGSRWFGSVGRRTSVLAFAVLIGVSVVAGGLWFGKSREHAPSQQLASMLVEDHLHNLPALMDVKASDHSVVQTWFQQRVNFTFRLPPTQDQSLVGGRLCNLQGKRAALILYQHNESSRSLFVFDGSDVELPIDRLIALDGRRCIVDTLKGFNVVLWKERGLVYGIVSDESTADLLQIAAQF